MKHRATARIMLVLASFSLWIAGDCQARIAEPDFTFYGIASRDGSAASIGDTVRVELDDSASCTPNCTLAQVTLSAPNTDPQGGYILRVPIDTLEPRVRPSGRPGEAVSFFINGELAGESFLGEAGEALRLNLDRNFQEAGLSIADVEFFEGNSGTVQAVFTVTIDPTTAQAVDFFFSTNSEVGTATECDPAVQNPCPAGWDYEREENQLGSIPANTESTTVTVTINGDVDDTESDELFGVFISDPVPDTTPLRAPTATGLIRDDDQPPVASIIDTSVMESGLVSVDASFAVSLSRPLFQGESAVTVSYETDTVGSSADAGDDYVSTIDSVIFGVGEGCPTPPEPCLSASKTINIEVLPDTINETDEVFFVKLNPGGGVTLAPSASRAQALILDDERFLRWVEEEKEGVDDGAGDVRGLDAAAFVVVTPDGNGLYVAGRSPLDPNDPASPPVGAISIFQRGNPAPTPDGELSYVGRVLQDDAAGLKLEGVSSLAISPDSNRSLYATGDAAGAVLVFTRNLQTGSLTLRGTVENGGSVTGLTGASSVVVDPAGEHVYVAGSGEDAIVVFSRTKSCAIIADCGKLTWVETQTDNPIGGEPDVLLGGVSSLAISADGARLYAAARLDNAVSIFDRDLVSGQLTRVGAVQNGINGVSGLNLARAVSVSPDGEHVYVSGQASNSLVVFARDAVSGLVTPPLQVLTDNTGGIDGLKQVQGVTVGSDGKYLFAAGFADDAISVFRRDNNPASPGFGTLSFVEVQRDEMGDVQGVARPTSVAVSPDARQDVYVTGFGDDAVVAFFREFDEPTNVLTLTSPSHLVGDSVSNASIELLWSGAADEPGGSGLAGYSIRAEPASGFAPDEFIEVEHRPDPNGTTLAPLPNGDWFITIRACDTGSNCSSLVSVVELGPLGIAAPVPQQPSNLAAQGANPCLATLTVNWDLVADPPGSSVDGYSVSFTTSPGSLCDGVIDTTDTMITSGALTDGVYFAHVCAVDAVGNRGDTAHLGPFPISTTLDADLDATPDCLDTCIDVDGDDFGILGLSGSTAGCVGGASFDCDDELATVYPGAPEICDGLDSNCDTVTPPIELDADGDGVSECGGDCEPNNPVVSPLAVELCRNTVDDNCNSDIDGADLSCLAPVCPAVTLKPSAGDDPDLRFEPIASCPDSTATARNVDLIWGDLSALVDIGAAIDLGTVNPLVCSGGFEASLVDNLRPDPGTVDFFLYRETGSSDYGTSSMSAGSLPRLPTSGDCP